MTWFRVDDGFVDHPKLEMLEGDHVRHAIAVAAWTLMGTDCARRRTDGRFTEVRLRRVLPWPEKQVIQARDALLLSGLWKREEGTTLVFHDWPDYQPTKAELEADRRAATERQKRWRQKRRQAVDASTNAVTDAVTDGVSRRDERRSSGASPVDAPVDATPSRPVPTHPEREGDGLAPVPRSRPSSDLISAIIAGTRQAYESIPLPAPKQTRALTWDGWHELAAWCESKAAMDGLEPEQVAQSLVVRFLSDKRAKGQGYPLPFLAQNPAQYWEAA